MKRAVSIFLAVLLIAVVSATGVLADQNPNASAKATAQITNLHVVSDVQVVQDNDEVSDWMWDWDTEPDHWQCLLTQTIKTANDKDLFIDASLLSGLYTKTVVRSKGAEKEASAAAGAVLLAVTVDFDEGDHTGMAWPGPIIYNARAQLLTATLQGVISNVYEEGIPVISSPEEIGLFIATMSANSFNWVVEDLDSGMHTVQVWVKCVTFAGTSKGSAEAAAVIGLGSVTVEEVRMVKGENVVIDLS